MSDSLNVGLQVAKQAASERAQTQAYMVQYMSALATARAEVQRESVKGYWNLRQQIKENQGKLEQEMMRGEYDLKKQSMADQAHMQRTVYEQEMETVRKYLDIENEQYIAAFEAEAAMGREHTKGQYLLEQERMQQETELRKKRGEMYGEFMHEGGANAYQASVLADHSLGLIELRADVAKKLGLNMPLPIQQGKIRLDDAKYRETEQNIRLAPEKVRIDRTNATANTVNARANAYKTYGAAAAEELNGILERLDDDGKARVQGALSYIENLGRLRARGQIDDEQYAIQASDALFGDPNNTDGGFAHGIISDGLVTHSDVINYMDLVSLQNYAGSEAAIAIPALLQHASPEMLEDLYGNLGPDDQAMGMSVAQQIQNRDKGWIQGTAEFLGGSIGDAYRKVGAQWGGWGMDSKEVIESLDDGFQLAYRQLYGRAPSRTDWDEFKAQTPHGKYNQLKIMEADAENKGLEPASRASTAQWEMWDTGDGGDISNIVFGSFRNPIAQRMGAQQNSLTQNEDFFTSDTGISMGLAGDIFVPEATGRMFGATVGVIGKYALKPLANGAIKYIPGGGKVAEMGRWLLTQADEILLKGASKGSNGARRWVESGGAKAIYGDVNEAGRQILQLDVRSASNLPRAQIGKFQLPFRSDPNSFRLERATELFSGATHRAQGITQQRGLGRLEKPAMTKLGAEITGQEATRALGQGPRLNLGEYPNVDMSGGVSDAPAPGTFIVGPQGTTVRVPTSQDKVAAAGAGGVAAEADATRAFNVAKGKVRDITASTFRPQVGSVERDGKVIPVQRFGAPSQPTRIPDQNRSPLAPEQLESIIGQSKPIPAPRIEVGGTSPIAPPAAPVARPAPNPLSSGAPKIRPPVSRSSPLFKPEDPRIEGQPLSPGSRIDMLKQEAQELNALMNDPNTPPDVIAAIELRQEQIVAEIQSISTGRVVGNTRTSTESPLPPLRGKVTPPTESPEMIAEREAAKKAEMDAFLKKKKLDTPEKIQKNIDASGAKKAIEDEIAKADAEIAAAEATRTSASKAIDESGIPQTPEEIQKFVDENAARTPEARAAAGEARNRADIAAMQKKQRLQRMLENKTTPDDILNFTPEEAELYAARANNRAADATRRQEQVRAATPGPDKGMTSPPRLRQPGPPTGDTPNSQLGESGPTKGLRPSYIEPEVSGADTRLNDERNIQARVGPYEPTFFDAETGPDMSKWRDKPAPQDDFIERRMHPMTEEEKYLLRARANKLKAPGEPVKKRGRPPLTEEQRIERMKQKMKDDLRAKQEQRAKETESEGPPKPSEMPPIENITGEVLKGKSTAELQQLATKYKDNKKLLDSINAEIRSRTPKTEPPTEPVKPAPTTQPKTEPAVETTQSGKIPQQRSDKFEFHKQSLIDEPDTLTRLRRYKQLYREVNEAALPPIRDHFQGKYVKVNQVSGEVKEVGLDENGDIIFTFTTGHKVKPAGQAQIITKEGKIDKKNNFQWNDIPYASEKGMAKYEKEIGVNRLEIRRANTAARNASTDAARAARGARSNGHVTSRGKAAVEAFEEAQKAFPDDMDQWPTINYLRPNPSGAQADKLRIVRTQRIDGKDNKVKVWYREGGELHEAEVYWHEVEIVKLKKPGGK